MVFPTPGRAEPIGLIERYALAEDRQAILRELIPGSEEYYQLHCLHYQVTGQLAQAEAMLARWEKDSSPPRGETPALRNMRDRQRLLTYATSPDRAVEYLRDRLNIQLEHPAPRRVGQRQWPDRLDQNLLNPEALIRQAIRDNHSLTPVALAWLTDWMLDGKVQNAGADLKWLSQQINGRWTPRLGELALAELRSRDPQQHGFGDRAIHTHLTQAELEAIRQAYPALASSDGLINQLLLRLRPDDDSDPGQQPEVRLDYLRRVEQFTQSLPESQNNLKAAAAYRLLEAHWMRDEYPLDLLLRYLQLPRRSGIVRSLSAAEQRSAAQLNVDFTKVALLPAIGNEEPLIRKYLEHFLRDADSTEQFKKLIENGYLTRVFAETKLLYGIGNPERWYGVLSADLRSQLTDRVELTLPSTNPAYTDPARPASLQVDLKHVDELIIRVYEINSEAYYRNTNKLINTDIDLDGLVATSEQRFNYSQPAILRHRESIELPSVSGRGVWVVDLLGGGLRARAILRRGNLRFTERMTPNGQQFVVLDENRQPLKQARMLVAGQEFLANDEGQIILPPVDQPLTRQAILLDDEIAVPVLFMHQGEQYSLKAEMLLNRQQLRTGKTANIAVRPRLSFNGEPLDIADLQAPVLTIKAVDHDGIETTKRIEDLQLSQLEETLVSFRVPSRLSTLQATLAGKLKRLATGRELELSDVRQWDINAIDKTSRTHDLHLTRDGQQWVAEVRGQTGEADEGVVVGVALTTLFHNQPITSTLETDAQGRVFLGELENALSVQLWTAEGSQLVRDLTLASAVWPDRLHGSDDQALQLPLMNDSDELGKNFQLLSMLSDKIKEDITDAALQVEAGMLKITPLPAGDYRLVYHDQEVIHELPISITAGPLLSGIAAGEIRHLNVRWPEPVSVAEMNLNDSGLQIQLSGDTSATRVHVIGSRYLPDYDPFALPTITPSRRGIQLAENGYVSDLRLGEEYRYVLQRQYAKKYPGVMLGQTSLLLAPWVTDATKNSTQTAASGDLIPEAEAAAPADMMADRARARAKRRGSQPTVSQNLNFLPTAGSLLTNLRPDADGNINIPADQLSDAIIFRIVVVDPVHTVERTVSRSLSALESRDLRLTTPLPAERPLAFERTVLVAGPDAPLEMKSIGSAQLQLYTEIGDLLQLFRTLSGDPRMDEFVELGRWNTLSDNDKRALYGRLACHELHIFIKAHDPKFFAQVVRPYLENKKEKQLVDHWLLDRDLTPWTDFWRYSRLNAFEKALLARQVPAIRETVLREMRERIALDDIAPEDIRRLIEVGLAGQGLAEGNKLGLMLNYEVMDEEAAEGQAYGDAFGLMEKSAADPFSADAAPEAPAGMGGGGMGGGMGGFAPGRANQRGATRGGRIAAGRSPAGPQRFFQQLDATKQWAENHWDHVRIADAGEALIPLNPFWLEWAEAAEDRPFVSSHVLRPTDNRHAALVALTLLGLPLDSDGVELPSEEQTVFTPDQPVVIITKRLKTLQPLDGNASLLVGQRFEAVDQQPSDNNDGEPKIAPEEFLTGRAYRGQIVLTNPTPTSRTVDCLWQIPAGSMPLAGSQATDSKTVVIKPFEVQRIEYQFYFPAAGEFQHYPVCLSSSGQVVARAEQQSFSVVSSPSKIDETSWEQIAQAGSADQIAEFLATANLRKLDLSLVNHRLRDRAVYDAVIGVVDNARVWEPSLWGYAFLYRDLPRMQSYLSQRTDFVSVVGPVLDSQLLTVEPISRGLYEHLEFAPLVSSRIHSLRPEPEILNDRFLQQYRSLMQIVAYQLRPSDEQTLALCHYLLLQNRIEEAISRFATIEREQIEMAVQYDYMAAYLALHQGNVEQAGKLAAAHAEHPVPRWRTRFQQVQDQLSQRRDLLSGAQLVNQNETPSAAGVREDAADLALLDREQRQADSAATAPDVRVRVEGDSLVIDHRNTEAVTINFYGVDLELLFSKTPFVRQGLQQMAMVRPGRVESLTVGKGDGSSQFRLDDVLSRQTLLVEVVSGASRDTTLYYGGRLKTYLSEGFGQLQVSDRTTGQPVETAYVKVYAKTKAGGVEFYKDGYTDLRGRFDYATLSTGDLASISSLAILVLDTERGATLHEVAPPTR
ncbi:hypothetical protein SH139x_005033 [Planctomycetaceae bacterium SH139]